MHLATKRADPHAAKSLSSSRYQKFRQSKPSQQFLRSGARLDFLEGGDDAGLKDVKPAGHMKTRDIDRATEIVSRTKGIRGWVRDDFIEKRLPQGKVWVAGQRQMQPVRRIDERRTILTGGVEPVVAVGRRGGGTVELGGTDPKPRHNRLAV